jgi:shikimate dehydrogenase
MRYAEVIGDPIAQSKSPTIHGFWLAKLGLQQEYRAAHVTSAGLADYLLNRRSDDNWRGCNVTMPHKQAIIPLLDRLDPLAAQIGAVNTVLRAGDGALIGTNTDAAGFLEPLQPLLGDKHLFRMARIIGAGGAARAIVAALSRVGFVLVVAARDPGKAQALLDELASGDDHHAVDLAHFAGSTDFAFDDRKGCFDLIVNASPLGMECQQALRFDFSHVPPGSVIYDIVTHPLETPLIKTAREQGFTVIDGLSMLIGQAAAGFEHFFGRLAPREFDAELRELLTK